MATTEAFGLILYCHSTASPMWSIPNGSTLQTTPRASRTSGKCMPMPAFGIPTRCSYSILVNPMTADINPIQTPWIYSTNVPTTTAAKPCTSKCWSTNNSTKTWLQKSSNTWWIEGPTQHLYERIYPELIQCSTKPFHLPIILRQLRSQAEKIKKEINIFDIKIWIMTS